MSGKLRILLLLALRSLGAHKVKNAIVGLIMLSGTFLVVTGTSLLDSMERSMRQSITASLTGDLQLYDEDAKDELAMFGGGMGSSDIGEIDDFSKVRAAVETVPGVAGVVPMGLTFTTIFGQNDIDRVLTDLRAAVLAQEATRVTALELQVRRIADELDEAYDRAAVLEGDPEKAARERALLTEVRQDVFWTTFEADPLPILDRLDSQLAPLATDGRLLYLRVLGTDLARFGQTFDRFYVVDGEAVPAGRRGLLISKRTYEKLLKHRVARELDDIKEQLDEGATIASDRLLADQVSRNSRQYQRVLFQLDPDDLPIVIAAVKGVVPDAPEDPAEALQAFLSMDDTNFAQRYALFYKEIAPRIRLYELTVGDTIPLRSFTKSGYMKSVNVKLYGTYEFKGLERSDLASATNLVDLITWRELYGKMTTQQQSELDDIRSSVKITEVSGDNLEAAMFGEGAPDRSAMEDDLFGGGTTMVQEGSTTGFDEFDGIELAGKAERIATRNSESFTSDEIDQGLALNVAVVLEDPDQLPKVRANIERVLAAQGLHLQTADWQAASGMLGQFVTVVRLVLYVAIFVIFLVALVIINNSMVMATMERTGEIGTMRAIGTQRGDVILLFLMETLLLGLISGTLGAGLAALFIGWLGHVGIPAVQDVLVILFAGPRLYPTADAANFGFGVAVITLVSLLSTAYPALLAARVPPVVAMQRND